MEHTTTHTGRRIRRELQAWCQQLDLPHAITLNADRPLSLSRLRHIFALFCLKCDRVVHDRKNVQSLSAADRMHAIAFPEHLDTNAHLHGLADLRSFYARFPSTAAAKAYLNCLWRQSTRGAGSVAIDPVSSAGWPRYLTKAVTTPDAPYFHSAEFHPHP
jgi:hypothetical protein